MSEPVAALKNASNSTGFAAISEVGPLGMITLRGPLDDRTLAKALVAEAGAGMPDPRQINVQDDNGVAWMSPDELLILCSYGDVRDRISALQDKLASKHVLLANVSDAQAIFRVTGSKVREVIAKIAPVDMHRAAFTPGMFRRTRFAQVPAAFWMPDEDTVQIICFRSVAQYMFDLLKIAAQPGSEVYQD